MYYTLFSSLFIFLVWGLELVTEIYEWNLNGGNYRMQVVTTSVFWQKPHCNKARISSFMTALVGNVAQIKFEQYWKLQDLSLAFRRKGQFSSCSQEKPKLGI
jgi:ribulose 1,5-bisphosphate carboxylase large subunit-like protein